MAIQSSWGCPSCFPLHRGRGSLWSRHSTKFSACRKTFISFRKRIGLTHLRKVLNSIIKNTLPLFLCIKHIVCPISLDSWKCRLKSTPSFVSVLGFHDFLIYKVHVLHPLHLRQPLAGIFNHLLFYPHVHFILDGGNFVLYFDQSILCLEHSSLDKCRFLFNISQPMTGSFGLS